MLRSSRRPPAIIALRIIALPQLSPGQHRLRVYALDPGFLLDRLDGAPDLYGAPPQD